MESMSHDPAAGAIGLHVVDIATRGLTSGAAASAPVTALVPAGADEVSIMAAAAFAAEGTAMLALNTAAQEEVARTGVALTDIARMYSQVDGEAAGALDSSGARIASHAFVGPTGGGLTGAKPPVAAGGSVPRTPPLTNLVQGGPVAAPAPPAPVTAPTVPSPCAAMPGAVNAASTLLGAGAAPLSSLGSIAQGASAGGASGPGLASSVTEQNDDESAGSQQPGQSLV
ncbi:hypothetical protein A5730_03515 [Mycobacterium sp. ACS4054]|nr:PE family protein [Mycobacterium sp. ACS4054]OBF12629.1 hypothetical protein A5730_03515 [Mycobacterium sp. ACS4054]